MSFPIKSVLISDEVAPKCVDILKQNGISVVKNTSLTKDELIAEIKNHDALIVRSATKVDASILQASSRLKVVGRAGTGVDNIDCVAATAAGVLVMNTPGGNTLSAAEHTCAMICAMTRHIAQGTESLRAGRWDRKHLMGSELMGKTLAIIGLGRIGKEVATRMQAFGMKTIGYDPIIPASVSAEFNCQWMELAELWPLADYITVHVPLLPSTKHLINNETLALCRRGVRVVNVARGGIVDEAALLAGLESGHVAGAALDVFVEEPPTDLALIRHARCVSTPHLGASTVEAQARVAEEIAEQLVELSAGRSLIGAINGQVAAQALSPNCSPWVALGQALGRLIAGIVAHDCNQVVVQLKGEELRDATRYMGAAVAAGLLGARTGAQLNLISAPPMAQAAGLDIICSFEAACPAVVSVGAGGCVLQGSVRYDGAAFLTQVGAEELVQPLKVGPASGALLRLHTQRLGAVFDALRACGSIVEAYSATRGGAHVCRLSTACDLSSLAGLATEVLLLAL